jgi:hypothetical protein
LKGGKFENFELIAGHTDLPGLSAKMSQRDWDELSLQIYANGHHSVLSQELDLDRWRIRRNTTELGSLFRTEFGSLFDSQTQVLDCVFKRYKDGSSPYTGSLIDFFLEGAANLSVVKYSIRIETSDQRIIPISTGVLTRWPVWVQYNRVPKSEGYRYALGDGPHSLIGYLTLPGKTWGRIQH